MKKNLISVIILALLLVNIALTAVMLFSVTSTNKATADMVTKIAAAMDMEVSSMNGMAPAQKVAMEDVVTYDIPEAMTIPLKKGDDDEDHYIMVAITLSMNSKHDDYKAYGATIDTKVSLIQSEIIDVVSGYTMEEARADQQGLKEDILKRIQDMFGSDFIFKVDFRDVKYSG